MTTLQPKRGLEIYQHRMKIELTFRHCKDLIHLPKFMNKRQDFLEKMISLTFIAFVVGLLFGEAIRDATYGHLDISQIKEFLFAEIPMSVS